MFDPLRSLAVAALVAITFPLAAFADELPDFVKDVKAGTIAAISDGDFIAETYGTGLLAPREAGLSDLLNVISIRNGEVSSATLPVSNSVTAAPEILALTRDGRSAFIAERLGQRSERATKITDLAPGNRLFATDLSRSGAPIISNVANVAAFPEGLSVSPDGRHIAVISNTAEASVVTVVPFAEGKFGSPAAFDLVTFGVTGSIQAPRGGVTATSVQWHPSGERLAINIDSQNRVLFLTVETADGIVLKPWGNVVEVGKDPFVGRFTPDGGYYITANWGRNFAAKSIAERLPTMPSSLSVVRLGTADDPFHEMVGSAKSDLSSEGIAVSPDGRLVATVNMRGTALPSTLPQHTPNATVSLLSFDPDTGKLVKLDDYEFEGVLPEGGTFDLTGEHFLATVFEGRKGVNAASGAGIEVFRVLKGDRPALKKLGRIPLPHGVHHVAVSN